MTTKKRCSYYYNAFEISKEQHLPKMTANIQGLIATDYLQKKDTLHANKYFNDALEAFGKLKDKKAAALLLNKMGELYLLQNDLLTCTDVF
jgi:hypothetical protein